VVLPVNFVGIHFTKTLGFHKNAWISPTGGTGGMRETMKSMRRSPAGLGQHRKIVA
jgi:hypothetical protein